MPTAETLERFIAQVERNAHAEALEEFYTADASMQENQSTPRVGRDALVANERRVLAKARALTSKCVRPVFVNGDRVVIRWILFNFEPPVTEEEIRAASLQFVRKVSGFHKPSRANEAAFLLAVDEIAAISRNLLNSLETSAPPRNRADEAAKARTRAAQRFPD